MAVVLETNLVFTKNVERTIFEASAPQLPGFFSGKMDLTQLTNAADEMQVRLQVKYSSGGTFRDAEQPTLSAKQADKIIRFTPVEETFGYKLLGTLLLDSPSATATLETLIIRSLVPS